MNINELIYLYFCKDEEALELLIKVFRPLVYSLIKKQYQYKIGINDSKDDFIQIADQQLVLCLDSYHPNSDISFAAYYKFCLINRFANTNKKLKTDSLGNHPNTLSLDAKIKEDESNYYLELLEDQRENVHQKTLNKLEYKRLMALSGKMFSKEEQTILAYVMDDVNMTEIARRMDLTPRQVRYRFAKMKKKIQLH